MLPGLSAPSRSFWKDGIGFAGSTVLGVFRAGPRRASMSMPEMGAASARARFRDWALGGTVIVVKSTICSEPYACGHFTFFNVSYCDQFLEPTFGFLD